MGRCHAAPEFCDHGQQCDLVPLLARPGRSTPADFEPHMIQAGGALNVVRCLKLDRRRRRQLEDTPPNEVALALRKC